MLEFNPEFRFLLNAKESLFKKKNTRSISFNKAAYFQSFKLKKKAFFLALQKKKYFEKRLFFL